MPHTSRFIKKDKQIIFLRELQMEHKSLNWNKNILTNKIFFFFVMIY